MGGPSFQSRMYPGIYALTPSLDRLQVPIIAMGVGWKSPLGEWQDTHQYPLSDPTRQLLDRVRDSGYLSSVRDYHTLNRSEEHTSELQSLMRNSYAVFCLKKKTNKKTSQAKHATKTK